MSHLPASPLCQILRDIPAVVFELVVDNGGRRFHQVSERSRTVLGLEPCELIDDPDALYRVVHQTDAEVVNMLFSATPAEGERTMRFRACSGDQIRTLELRYTETLKEGGLIRRGFIVEQEAEIRKNESLFRQLFQNLPMAVVMLDEKGRLTEINREFEVMFGYTIDELSGRNLNDYIVPDNLQSEGIDLNNLIVSHQVVSVETVRKHRSGKLVNVLLYGVPVVLDNEAIAIYGVYVDITDRKKVEEELKIRNAELDNFVYKVSHDLRAPLSSILGLVNLTRFQENKDDPREYIELIGNKIQALDNFISDVLSHSKNLKMDVEIRPVNLEKVIHQTFVDLSYLAGADEMKRTVRVTGLEFHSDPWRIAEIFRNLISNAIKYRQPDYESSEIVIKINVDHLCADIIFTDNGIGIKDASLKRIFEMFYRATDQSDGSGIGLYIVKNAVDKLGGKVSVVSRPGEGTRFHILLPNRIDSMIKVSELSPDER